MQIDEAFLNAAPEQHLLTRAELRNAGVKRADLDRALAAHQVRRMGRGVYSSSTPKRAQHLVSGGVPDAGYLAEVRAVLKAMGSSATAGGRTAAVLWGFDMAIEPAKVDVAIRQGCSRRNLRGVRLREHRNLDVVELAVLELAPLRVLSATATVLDCAATRPLAEAVVIADSALRQGAVTLAELQEAQRGWEGKPGARRLREVIDLVDPDSGSVLESLVRVLLAEHGLRPESQVTVFSARGKRIGRVDFLFREERLVIECDGRRWHDPEDARERDRIRDNELERAAWRLVRVTWAEVMHDPARVVELVGDCLRPWPAAA